MIMDISRPSREKQNRSVAIIGGGIAGLSCAQLLLEQAPRHPSRTPLEVTVFDTGRLRPGGRTSSRQPGDPPKEGSDGAGKLQQSVLSRYRFDHAAQVVQVKPSDPNCSSSMSFHRQVDQWVQQGVLRPFAPGSLFRLSSASDMQDLQPASITSPRFFYAPEGLGSLPAAMVARCREVSTNTAPFDLRQDVWVSPSNGVRYIPQRQQWKLQAKGRILGYFDDLVIAHNGKCADRLMSQTPAKDVHSLLRVDFAASVPPVARRMTLNSIYSWTFCIPSIRPGGSALQKALGESFACGFVDNSLDLRFLTCQTRKLDQLMALSGSDGEFYEVWTVLSSPAFAKRHKAPQEALGEETIKVVTELLSQALQEYLQLPEPLDIIEQRLQLWGAALPLNVWNNGMGFVHDGEFNVGVCGDWLVEASIGGAWTSGRLLAEHLLSSQNDPDRQSLKLGLDGAFQRSAVAAEAGIGALDDGGVRSPRPRSAKTSAIS